jgi:hypothetical protein
VVWRSNDGGSNVGVIEDKDTHMKRVTPKETMKIMEYLASPAGRAVFQEIEGKDDEYRVVLRIPEPGGHFIVKMSAGSIREAVRSLVSAALGDADGGEDVMVMNLHSGSGKSFSLDAVLSSLSSSAPRR